MKQPEPERDWGCLLAFIISIIMLIVVIVVLGKNIF